MTWYIIRHAEKEEGEFYNPRLRHQDQPISQKGREEAQKLSSFFTDKQISAIYVSAYQRTTDGQGWGQGLDDRMTQILLWCQTCFRMILPTLSQR